MDDSDWAGLGTLAAAPGDDDDDSMAISLPVFFFFSCFSSICITHSSRLAKLRPDEELALVFESNNDEVEAASLLDLDGLETPEHEYFLNCEYSKHV